MRFEWDSEKDRINQRKHGGIAFESAALVFDDPHMENDNGEEEIIRIPERAANGISAREANQRERRVHFQQAAE
jgi:uncharacterized DUF497 family protein